MYYSLLFAGFFSTLTNFFEIIIGNITYLHRDRDTIVYSKIFFRVLLKHCMKEYAVLKKNCGTGRCYSNGDHSLRT